MRNSSNMKSLGYINADPSVAGFLNWRAVLLKPLFPLSWLRMYSIGVTAEVWSGNFADSAVLVQNSIWSYTHDYDSY